MAGGGRSNGVSAVTGHGKRKGGGGYAGNVRRAGSSSNDAKQSANVTRTASMLSAISSRRDKFDN